MSSKPKGKPPSWHTGYGPHSAGFTAEYFDGMGCFADDRDCIAQATAELKVFAPVSAAEGDAAIRATGMALLDQLRAHTKKRADSGDRQAELHAEVIESRKIIKNLHR